MSALSYAPCAVGLVLAVAGFHCRGKGDELIDIAALEPLALADKTVAVDDLHGRLRPDTGQVTYQPMSKKDTQAFAKLIPGLLGPTAPSADQLRRWNALAHAVGYSLEIWHVDDDRYAVLGELPDRRRGGGTYVFRLPRAGAARAPGQPRPRRTILLQAPHVYFDLGTGKLAIHLFFAAPYRHRFRALYMNSLHRYQPAPDKRDDSDDSPADVCHNSAHLFHYATRMSADHVSSLRVVQLHGFDKREDDEDEAVDVIVSATTPALTDEVATALEQRFSGRDIRRYPGEFDQLGGDTNVQRKLVARYADADFVHLEMSRAFRTHLRKRKKGRDHLAVALVESALGAGPPARSSP